MIDYITKYRIIFRIIINMGVFLYILAYLLYLPLSVINFFFVRSKGYFKDSAINIDKFANREFRTGLNKTLIKSNSPFLFGDINETISSVLGKNEQFNFLTKFGKVICFILDAIDKNHCEKSIRWNKLNILKMDNKKVLVEQEPTADQLRVIEEVIVLLGSVDLELIGTRPSRR